MGERRTAMKCNNAVRMMLLPCSFPVVVLLFCCPGLFQGFRRKPGKGGILLASDREAWEIISEPVYDAVSKLI